MAHVAASRAFQKSARQRDVLLYLCERVLAEPGTAIREQDIGSAVFGRTQEYDTGQDNIVRVHLSELRRRLEKYFEGEGAGESWVIEIPKGSYCPVFTPRTTLNSHELPTPPSSAPSPPVLWMTMCAGLALLSAFLAWQNWEVRRDDGAATPSLRLLWTRMAVPNQRTDLVLADSNISLAQDLTGQAVSLNRYLDRKDWPDLHGPAWSPERKRDIEALLERRYTSISDAEFVQQVLSLGLTTSAPPHICYARDYVLQNLQENNVILVGSPRSNPWTELLQERLNFRFEIDPATAIPRYRNISPKPGELPLYELKPGEPDGDAFGQVAFVPNLSRKGNILSLSGTGIHAIRAGGDLLTAEDLFAPLCTRLTGGGAKAALPYFEALYRTHRVRGIARGCEIVGVRVHQNSEFR